jgi:ABC-type phosphate/phosphonate transport system substrate-binding protein
MMVYINRARHFLTLFCLTSALCTAAIANDNKPKYTFGVFPHLPIIDLERIYAPMAADLAKELNIDLYFQSKATFEDFKMELESETYDFIEVQPFDYVDIAARHHYVPLARRNQPLAGVFVVPPHSKIKKPKDLIGKRIALPPKSSAVSRLASDYLLANGIKKNQLRMSYHRSHVNCLQQILIKKADVCVTAEPTLRFFNHKMKTDLHFVLKTKSIPHVLFAAHTRVPEKLRKQAIQVITTWDDIEEKRKLLTNAKFPPFVPALDSEYDAVRKIINEK